MSGTGNKRTYRLISADGHLNEPADVWTSRAASKYRDLVPRVASLEKGDAWVFPGYDVQVPFSWGACAGRDPKTMNQWCRYEDINPGSYDPKARLLELDEDGVDAELASAGGRLLFGVGGPAGNADGAGA